MPGRAPAQLPRAARLGRGADVPLRRAAAAQLEFFGNTSYAELFDASVQRLRELGGEALEVDIEPLLETARLLYEGPWVAERYLATESLLTARPEAMLDVTRQIISGGANPKALDAFRAQYRLKDLIRRAQSIWEAAPLLLLPTAGTHYRIADEQADPIRLNSTLGRYTNFVNLMDLAAVAVPAGFTPAATALRRVADRARVERCRPARARGSTATRLRVHTRRHVDTAAGRRTCAWRERRPRRRHGLRRAHVRAAAQQATARARRVADQHHAHRAYLPLLRPARGSTVPARAGAGERRWRRHRRRGVAHAGRTLRLVRRRNSGAARHRQGEARGRQQRFSGFLCESLGVADATDISALGGWRQHLRSVS